MRFMSRIAAGQFVRSVGNGEALLTKCRGPLLVGLFAAISNVALSDVIYSSYPNTSDPMLGLNATNSRGVLFSVGDSNYYLNQIVAPLAFLPGYILPGMSNPIPPAAALSVNFQIWSSRATLAYGDARERPFEMLDSWTTTPIPANVWNPETRYDFHDIAISTLTGLTLNKNESYWFVINTGWSDLTVNPNANIQWAGSSVITGYGHGLEIVGTPGMEGDMWVNMDPGGFPGFRIEGAVITASIPEPEIYTMLMLGLGLMGAIAHRRRNKQA